MLLLRATISPVDGDDPPRDLEVVAASFDQGIVEIDTLTPPGWRRRHVVIQRPGPDVL